LINAQQIDSSGDILWPAEGVTINETFTSSASDKGIVSDGDGGAYIVWRDHRNMGTTDWDLYGQRLNGLGDRLWETGGTPIVVTPEDQGSFDIMSAGPGGVFVAWADNRGDSLDIYAHKVFDAGLIFVDGFETGDPAWWDRIIP